MALGTLTSVSQNILPGGPTFIDRCSLVGDSAYPTGGTAGLQAALRALRKDQRTIVSVHMYKSTSATFSVRFDPATGLLTTFTSAAAPVVEVSNATDTSAQTFLLEIVSQ